MSFLFGVASRPTFAARCCRSSAFCLASSSSRFFGRNEGGGNRGGRGRRRGLGRAFPGHGQHWKSGMNAMHLRDAQLDRAELSPETQTLKGSFKGKELRRAIRQLKRGSDIVAFVKSQLSTHCDVSVFTMAMKHCWTADVNFRCAHQLFKMAIKHQQCNSATYAIFLDICAECQKYEIAFRIFSQMQANGELDCLNGPAFSSLIKCCKPTGDMSRAKQFLEMNKQQTDITPLSVSVTLFLTVCAKAADMDSANAEFLSLCRTNTGELDIRLFNTMLSVCSNCNDITAALHLEALRKEYGVAAHDLYWITFASCRCKQEEFDLAMQCLDKAAEIRVSHQLFRTKLYVFLLQMKAMRSQTEKQQKWKQMLEVYKFMQTEKMRIRLDSHQLVLSGNVAHNEPNWQHSIRFFQGFLDDGKFGLWTNDNCIDFHHFSPEISVFVLRYLFSVYSRKMLAQTFATTDGSEVPVILVCGRGKHSSALKKKTHSPLPVVVANELLSWTPPIRTSVHRTNPGCLVCDGKDVAEFFKTVPVETFSFCKSPIFGTADCKGSEEDEENEEELRKDS